ncbi:MAG: N-acetyl-gamma-glutamyl-phosphate reductase [Planctomycetota bacterium]
MTHRIGIAGVSGYGGGETLRIALAHPAYEVAVVYGEGSAGKSLSALFPQWDVPDLMVQPFVPEDVDVDLLFASLPTGASLEPLARVPAGVRIVDIGGDHRPPQYAGDDWVYGLPDAFPERSRGARRVANPGCFPAASLTALLPITDQLTGTVVIDAKTGVSGAGRGGAQAGFGYAEINESLHAYRIGDHAHEPEIATALGAEVLFVPHLVPMTRGILATCYVTGVTAEQARAAATALYAGSPFVRIVEQPPKTKWAAGSNRAFVSYHDTATHLVACCAIDNLGKGAAGTAVQNANLMLGLEPDAGLQHAPLWP